MKRFNSAKEVVPKANRQFPALRQQNLPPHSRCPDGRSKIQRSSAARRYQKPENRPSSNRRPYDPEHRAPRPVQALHSRSFAALVPWLSLGSDLWVASAAPERSRTEKTRPASKLQPQRVVTSI